MMEKQELPGGYILVTTYAHLTDKEYEQLLRDGDEYPTTTVAVDKTFLVDYAGKVGYSSLDEFLNNYTYDQTDGLEDEALCKDACAFCYRIGLPDEKRWRFPEYATPIQMQALLAFVEGQWAEKLQKEKDMMQRGIISCQKCSFAGKPYYLFRGDALSQHIYVDQDKPMQALRHLLMFVDTGATVRCNFKALSLFDGVCRKTQEALRQLESMFNEQEG